MNKVVPFERGNEYLMHRAQLNRRAGRLLDALALQRRAAEREGSAACLMDLAQTLCEMGCYEQSNRVLAGILGEGDPPSDCYFGLCCNYVGMGQHDLAYRAMVQFLAKDPQAVNRPEVGKVFHNLIRMRVAQEDAFASRSARRAAQLAQAAQERMALGQSGLALTLIKRALLAQNGADDGPLRAQLALLLSLQNLHAQATTHIDRALAAPQVTDAMLAAAATIYHKAGKASPAQKAIARLEARNPQGESLRLLLDACCALGDDNRVRLLAPKALRDAPYDRRLLHQCAVNRIREQRPAEQAISFWTRALRIDPGDVIARWNVKQAASGKLDPNMPYDYALPAPEAQKWRRQLCAMLWMDGHALAQRFHKSRAMTDKLQWALYGPDHQARLLARKVLSAIPDPAAKRLLNQSLAMPGSAQEGQGAISPDVSMVRVPPLVRRAMKDAIALTQQRYPGIAHRVVRLVLWQMDKPQIRLPRDGAALAAAMVYLAAGDKEDAPTVNEAAAWFDASPRRAARCAAMLGGEKERETDATS